MSIGSNSYASETSQSPQIFVRLRPPLRSELKLTSESLGAVSIPGPSTVRISQTDYSKDFTFTSVFPEFTPQAEVFEHSALPLVHHVLNGYNGVYFVYGQTGTGKTHTMGTLTKMTVSSQGVIPQSLDYIFRYIEANQSADCSFEVRVSFYQIYLDAIQDLLNPENKNLNIHEDEGEIYVDDLVEVPVGSVAQAMKLINAGLDFREVAAQNMNITSSRSHTILNIELFVNAR